MPSVFYEWELPDRDDGVPKCEMRGVASYSLSDEGRAGRSSDTPGNSGWTNLVANTGNANRTYSHTGLSAGATRYYRVSAINSAGTGLASNVANGTTSSQTPTAPGPPTNLGATASGQTHINLTWNAPTSDGGSSITGYKIEVSSNGNSGWTSIIYNSGNANRTFSHTGIPAGDTRYYRVSAINFNGTGPASNVANATTGPTTVSFGAVNYTATEGGSSATVIVNLRQRMSAAVTIPLTTQHLGGATAADYTVIPASVRFPSGQTWRTFTVRATDDSVDDDGESLSIGFGTLPSGVALGSRTTTTVALDDNDGSRQVVLEFDTNIHYTIELRESNSLSRITMSLDRTPLRTLTIPLVVMHVGGATEADYTGIPASVTFGANDRKASISMRAIPDEEREIGEGLRIAFGTLPPSVRSWGHETIEFVDVLPESKVRFGAESYTATEGGGSAPVSIHLDAPVKLEPLDVRLSLRYGGGATAADHGSIPTVVRFALGQQTKTITVAATDDTDDDDGESVSLSLRNGDRVNLGGPNTATVALEDNDGPKQVAVSFGAATYTATEGGSGATVRVELDAAPGRSVTVPLLVTYLGGASEADYTGIPASVTFGANETAKTFTVTAADDSADDGGESLSIGFGTLPASVSAGNPATATVSLADNSSLRQVVVRFGTHTDETIEVRERRWGFRITISLDQKPLRPVTIPLVVTHLGGATAADYTGIPGSVTFKANQKQSGFNMKAVLDEEIETGEGLRIDFGPMPPGVSVSSSRPYETIAFVDTSAAP